MGKRGPKPKPVAAPPLKAKGKGPVKRTPTSAFDAAANDDNVYQCEKIVGQRLAKGVTQFCVTWAGYDTKDNTWEPIENLAGCESFIADFKEREKTRIAQLEAAAEQKHRRTKRRPHSWRLTRPKQQQMRVSISRRLRQQRAAKGRNGRRARPLQMPPLLPSRSTPGGPLSGGRRSMRRARLLARRAASCSRVTGRRAASKFRQGQ